MRGKEIRKGLSVQSGNKQIRQAAGTKPNSSTLSPIPSSRYGWDCLPSARYAFWGNGTGLPPLDRMAPVGLAGFMACRNGFLGLAGLPLLPISRGLPPSFWNGFGRYGSLVAYPGRVSYPSLPLKKERESLPMPLFGAYP